jgi:hypothetical protein
MRVPLCFASGTVVSQVEEPVPAPESVPQTDHAAPFPIGEDVVPDKAFPVLVEEEMPEEITPVLVEEDEPKERHVVVEEGPEPEELPPVLVEEEEQESTPVVVEETEAPAAPESTPTPAPPEPVYVPVAVEGPVSAPAQEPKTLLPLRPRSLRSPQSPYPRLRLRSQLSPPLRLLQPSPCRRLRLLLLKLPRLSPPLLLLPPLPSTGIPKTRACPPLRFVAFNSDPHGATHVLVPWARNRHEREKRQNLLGKLRELFSDKA